MSLRPTQSSIFSQVRLGILLNQAKLARAQEQVASGKRIQRVSDDAVGTSLAIGLRRQAKSLEAFREAVGASRPTLNGAASELQNAASLLGEARALVLQALSGTLGPEDREALAHQIELAADGIQDLANSRFGERFLFSGSETATEPFETVRFGDRERVVYRGNEDRQSVFVGRGVRVELNVPGTEIFARNEYVATQLTGSTGIAGGSSADSGAGYNRLVLRHDATTGLGAGLASAPGDTILGDHALVVDAAAGTVRLGSGPARALPAPGDPDHGDFRVEDADGSEVHLDFGGWTGASFSGTLTGSGSIAIGGDAFAPIDFGATDVELIDSATGDVVHVDTSGVTRAGEELVTFRGAANVFDTLRGIADDLRRSGDLAPAAIQERVGARLVELDRNAQNVLAGLGQLGGRTARLDAVESRLADLLVRFEGMISDVEDADLASVVLDMTQAEQTLQVAQAAGARLLQNTLLNFLR